MNAAPQPEALRHKRRIRVALDPKPASPRVLAAVVACTMEHVERWDYRVHLAELREEHLDLVLECPNPIIPDDQWLVRWKLLEHELGRLCADHQPEVRS